MARQSLTDLRRPAVRYMGGKWRVAPWIVSQMPKHRVYVEAFAGGASVLLRKPRSYAEIYNDLDGQVVNVFRCLRDPAQGKRLAELVALTPFAREEFELTYGRVEDPLEEARRFIARSYMGHGSTAVALRRRTGFRSAGALREGTTPSMDWARLPAGLLQITERLRGVVIESRPAIDVMARFDTPNTLQYCDPPYLHETRSRKRVRGALEHAYSVEMSEAQHRELLAFLRELKGMVMVSSYSHPLYDVALAGWKHLKLATHADGARPRTEVLWLNPKAAECPHGPLFESRSAMPTTFATALS